MVEVTICKVDNEFTPGKQWHTKSIIYTNVSQEECLFENIGSFSCFSTKKKLLS